MRYKWSPFRTVRSNKFVTIVGVIIVLVLMCAFLVPFFRITDYSKRRLSTAAYLAKFSWSYPGGQIPTLHFESDVESVPNPGCMKPRRLAAYKPSSKSPFRFYHQPIVHFAKMFPPDHPRSSEPLTFKEYLSMLSYYRFLKPKIIALHSNVNVEGRHWMKAQKWKGTIVMLNKVDTISKMQGRDVVFWQHAADYVKISQVLEHGGIASDFDVIFLNRRRYKDESRRAECVLSCEGKNCTKINGGFYSCAKNSLFMLNWLRSYHEDYRPWEWVFNAGDIPTQLLLNSSSMCHSVYVDETIAANPGFYEASKQWLKKGGVDWKNKMVTHYYLRRFDNVPSDESILKLDNSFGEMMRYVAKGYVNS